MGMTKPIEMAQRQAWNGFVVEPKVETKAIKSKIFKGALWLKLSQLFGGFVFQIVDLEDGKVQLKLSKKYLFTSIGIQRIIANINTLFTNGIFRDLDEFHAFARQSIYVLEIYGTGSVIYTSDQGCCQGRNENH